MADNEISADSILPFVGSLKRIKVYMMSIAVAEKYRRWGEGISQQAYLLLLTGFLDKLTHYGKQYGTRVTHFIATAWTPEGRRICELFGMSEVGKDQFGDAIFELDLTNLRGAPGMRLMPALRHLLKVYDQVPS